MKRNTFSVIAPGYGLTCRTGLSWDEATDFMEVATAIYGVLVIVSETDWRNPYLRKFIEQAKTCPPGVGRNKHKRTAKVAG